MQYSKSSSKSDDIQNNLADNEDPDLLYIKTKPKSKIQIPLSSQPGNTPLQVKFQNVDQINPQQSSSHGGIRPMFFNPFFTHPIFMNHPNINYLNHGIFIPQTTENNQFFFIPGNISTEMNNFDNEILHNPIDGIHYSDMKVTLKECDELSENDNEIRQSDRSSKQLYFVPNLTSSQLSIKEELRESDDYDTYLVPIKIKKEENGNIELLPESTWEIQTQQMNPEQLNILKKIYLLKNQNKIEEKTDEFGQIVNIDETFIENLGHGSQKDGNEIINNIQKKSQGYMMVRFNKTLPNEISKQESEDVSKTLTSFSLKLSAAESFKSSNDTLNKRFRNKKKPKPHILTLSAQMDKNTIINQSTSRFRRLRLDDKTHCWHLNTVSCIDTKMRVIPRNILNLSKTNSVTIPAVILRIFSKPEISNVIGSDVSITCEHTINQENQKNIQSNTGSLLKYVLNMCSMNNCEFSKSQTEIK